MATAEVPARYEGTREQFEHLYRAIKHAQESLVESRARLERVEDMLYDIVNGEPSADESELWAQFTEYAEDTIKGGAEHA